MLVKFKKTEKFVSIFIVMGLIVLLVSLVLIGRGKRLFDKKYYFYTVFKTGDGLNKGMAVNMNDFQIGILDRVRLDENNHVELRISIFEEHLRRIKTNSVVRLNSPLFGAKSLEIIYGGNTAPIAEVRTALASYDSDEGKKILQNKKDELAGSPIENIMLATENVLTNVAQLVQKINEPEGPLFSNLENFKKISNNIGALSEKLVKNQERIDKIFKYAEDTTANMETISRSVMGSQFFKKDDKNKKSSIDLNETYDPYKNK